jgi:hypothetical protein
MDDNCFDHEFAIEAAQHAIRDGRTAFEREDFVEASEPLKEALKWRELPLRIDKRYVTLRTFDICWAPAHTT